MHAATTHVCAGSQVAASLQMDMETQWIVENKAGALCDQVKLTLGEQCIKVEGRDGLGRMVVVVHHSALRAVLRGHQQDIRFDMPWARLCELNTDVNTADFLQVQMPLGSNGGWRSVSVLLQLPDATGSNKSQ